MKNEAIEYFEKRIASEAKVMNLPTCDDEVRKIKRKNISYMQEAINAMKIKDNIIKILQTHRYTSDDCCEEISKLVGVYVG